ncbi:MAG: aldehyde ferredoxin oxidoreductase C-terminal domain-containing protein [Ignavibacteriales bacterium]|nr:aldehyde ferredoxin oxidoreductase C-terminal domain-containing protein [Ignavibacteriales bacterium]
MSRSAVRASARRTKVEGEGPEFEIHLGVRRAVRHQTTCPPSSKRTPCATTWAWIRSLPARRSPARWNSLKRGIWIPTCASDAPTCWPPPSKRWPTAADLGADLTDGSLRLATKYRSPGTCPCLPRGWRCQPTTRAACRDRACCMPRPTAADVTCAVTWSGLEVLGLPKLIDRFQVQGKSSFVILHQNTAAAIDSLVLCKFTNIRRGRGVFCARSLGGNGNQVCHRRHDQSGRARLESGAAVQPA